MLHASSAILALNGWCHNMAQYSPPNCFHDVYLPCRRLHGRKGHIHRYMYLHSCFFFLKLKSQEFLRSTTVCGSFGHGQAVGILPSLPRYVHAFIFFAQRAARCEFAARCGDTYNILRWIQFLFSDLLSIAQNCLVQAEIPKTNAFVRSSVSASSLSILRFKKTRTHPR